MIIGRAVGDSLLLLYLRGPRRGEVHLVDTNLVGEPLDLPTAEDIEKTREFVAPSFGAFLSMLFAEAILDRLVWTRNDAEIERLDCSGSSQRQKPGVVAQQLGRQLCSGGVRQRGAAGGALTEHGTRGTENGT